MKFSYGVLPLVNFHNQKETEETLSALLAEGIETVEIVCRAPYATEAIAFATKKYKNLSIGAGTILNEEQANRALDAGAAFLISPGLSQKIARIAEARNVPYYPGCVTPTEIMQALDLNISTVKFFPAETCGGVNALRALRDPFRGVKFLPTGGITMESFSNYLALDEVEAVGGSFVLRGDLKENCAKIRSLGRKA